MNNDTPTRLDELVLENFRCFRKVEIQFDPRLTVFVARNGGGKTAILDAIAIAWRQFVDTLETRNVSQGFESADIRLERKVDSMEPQLPTRFAAKARILNEAISENVKWARERNSFLRGARTSTFNSGKLKLIAAELMLKVLVQEDNIDAPPVLPIVAYYGTGRLFGEERNSESKKKDDPSPTSRLNGYKDCLKASSKYKFFIDWFERYSRAAQQESTLTSPDQHRSSKKIQAVRDVVDLILKPTGWHSIRWDFVEARIVAVHEVYGVLPVDMLSDGIRNIIGLVADIAHRCVRLNPQFDAEAPSLTSGIVLIDEVDMHLHPEWQQTIIHSLLNAFPKLQFIVTTHSPQVITTVRKENIRIIKHDDIDGHWTVTSPERSAFAHEAGDALAFVLDANPRPPEPILADVNAYEQLARTGGVKSPEAKLIKQRLDDAGFEFNDAENHLFDFLATRQTNGRGN